MGRGNGRFSLLRPPGEESTTVVPVTVGRRVETGKVYSWSVLETLRSNPPCSSCLEFKRFLEER